MHMLTCLYFLGYSRWFSKYYLFNNFLKEYVINVILFEFNLFRIVLNDNKLNKVSLIRFKFSK